MVRLLLENPDDDFCNDESFNSSMVRLLQKRLLNNCRSGMFQFLNGTIITYVGIVNTCSLLVSIPQWYDYYRREFDNLSAVERGFNSSMVRLLLRNTNKRATYHLGFNSSMVRLLHNPVEILLHKSDCFNSSMVRLLQ